MRTPARLVAPSLIVLLALGGSSLAVGADTTNLPPTPAPVAIPSALQSAPGLMALDSATADLARAARDSADSLQALDLDATRAAIARGDSASARVLTALASMSDEADDEATDATAMTNAWAHLRTQASAVVALLSNLQGHDSAVISATAKGRSGDWADAVGYLNEASAWLSEAKSARTTLGNPSSEETLDELVDRDSSYDAALHALYTFMAKGHEQTGRKFMALSRAVSEAQAGLPASNEVLSFIVGEAAGATLYGDLLDMERGRSKVASASGSVQ
ncbi:MAG TPA: hypothetical protein VH371_11545 [Candidatus Limnocylindrales bacterium]